MAKVHKKIQDPVSKVYATLSLIAAVTLIMFGSLAWWGHSYASNMVRTELAAQKVYFPDKGAPNFNPEAYPELQQYSGQLVDSGDKARAYANGYIGRHLKKVADGKVYAEVSAEYQKDPTNEKLAQQRQALFMGETLRGILLGTGFAFGLIAQIAKIASLIMFALSGVMIVLALWFSGKLFKR